MLDKNLIQSTSSWPFVEIRKLLKERKDYYEKSSNVTISTDNYDTVKISRIIIKNFEEYEKNNS